MALDFIPTVWAARLLTALDKALIYGQANVSNRDYEGEIQKAGNTVKIASISEVNVNTYTKDSDIADPELLTDDEQTLLIDKAKYSSMKRTLRSTAGSSSCRLGFTACC